MSKEVLSIKQLKEQLALGAEERIINKLPKDGFSDIPTGEVGLGVLQTYYLTPEDVESQSYSTLPIIAGFSKVINVINGINHLNPASYTLLYDKGGKYVPAVYVYLSSAQLSRNDLVTILASDTDEIVDNINFERKNVLRINFKQV